ncbi:hypothetical protein V7S43_013788 [Phytophthora oleae]|uniref:CRAL-TRIO domain-containing protein n=1 Tax=Phytophthora oleae TaxID=2107226 RepID=A0ABD3F668_9STRA
MAFRSIFWSWAFYAPLDINERVACFILKPRAVRALLRFISLCIESWGYYSFCKRLDANDDLSWYGGIPLKGSIEDRTDSEEYAEDLATLYRTRRPRYKFIIDHALDPSYSDDFGYRNLSYLLESTGALDPDADPESRLSDMALANIRQDMMSKISMGWRQEYRALEDAKE